MGALFGTGNALLGLLAAALWGVGDFSGGMGVKTAGGSMGAALRVVLLSHITSFSFLLLTLFVRGDAIPDGRFFAWGIAAGIAGGLSLTAFYMAISRGAMGAAAAVSGLLAAAIPAVVAMALEGTPGWRKGVGFLVAGIAIWMIAAGPSDDKAESSTMWLAVAAGAGFGFYFVALKYAGTTGPVWSMAMARMGSISICGLLLLALRGVGTVRITRKVVAWVLATALFDTSGNLFFVAATRAGRLDVAAVLASLYPASTILLAAWMLKERPTKRQGWGMVVAAGAVILIAG
jgi:drug/metabolite transporter (DMT)-like permease